MQLIQTVTVGAGGQANIEFGAGNTLPQTFTDLVLLISPRLSASNPEGVFMRFNSNTSGYTSRDLFGDGSSAGSSTNPYGITNALFLGSHAGTAQTSNTFGSIRVYIPNYKSSTSKSVSTESVMENNATLGYMDTLSGLWTGTSPITNILLFSNNGNFVQFSSASLYGITAGSDGIVTVS